MHARTAARLFSGRNRAELAKMSQGRQNFLCLRILASRLMGACNRSTCPLPELLALESLIVCMCCLRRNGSPSTLIYAHRS